jgi:hypothetical protein
MRSGLSRILLLANGAVMITKPLGTTELLGVNLLLLSILSFMLAFISNAKRHATQAANHKSTAEYFPFSFSPGVEMALNVIGLLALSGSVGCFVIWLITKRRQK